MMTRMRLLDAFCCQGGASAGYVAAGFQVEGVDIAPQPRYPYDFHLGDAIRFIRKEGTRFDFIHASPPCQAYSATQRINRISHPDLIGATRDALNSTGRPWVIENVAESFPFLINPKMLCGGRFGLHTYRHRLFEFGGWPGFEEPHHVEHTFPTVKMGRPLKEGDFYHAVGNFSNVPYVRSDMGVPWMNRDGIRECIPPCYAEFIGRAFLEMYGLAHTKGVR